MDGWLKGLIAAACVVVIAGGGYFAWSEYRSAQAASAAQERGLERAAFQSERAKCLEALQPHRVSQFGEEKRIRDKCRQDGFITYDEQLKAGG